MIFFENTLVTVISLSTPLIIAVIGETISEKGGVINLSAEGTIMTVSYTHLTLPTIYSV